jgi:hypothetical protein
LSQQLTDADNSQQSQASRTIRSLARTLPRLPAYS